MKILLSSIIAVVALCSVNTAQSQNLKSLTSTDQGNTLEVCFDIAGLGNVSQTKLVLNFTSTATTECTNKGGNVAPGQTKTTAGSQEFLVTVRNGRAVDCVVTTEPTAGKCPGGFFGGTVTGVTFSDVSISIGGKTFTAQ
jgi:hypothetical protein